MFCREPGTGAVAVNTHSPCPERGHHLAGRTDSQAINMQTSTDPQMSINALKGKCMSHECEGDKNKKGENRRAGLPEKVTFQRGPR